MRQNDKKLVGIYLPGELITRLKVYIFENFTKKSIPKSQSEVVEDALMEYLDKNEMAKKGKG